VTKIKNNPRLASNFINRTINGTTARESVTVVNLFYDDLNYMFSTESPQMDMAALLASIGGNLGLFLGLSVYSLCELSGIAFEIILILLKKNKTASMTIG
jgi:hypothetical protein